VNAEIKARWLKALRSGEYKQAKNALRAVDGSGYCCLGVLCELHRLDHNGVWDQPNSKSSPSYLGQEGILPEVVAEWAGLPKYPSSSVVCTNPEVQVPRNEDDYVHPDREPSALVGVTLGSCNDNRDMDFNAIADTIEAQL
jgi:hypothetical protein